MSFITSYITENFIAYPGDVISTNLTFAVWLRDDFTSQYPLGNITVLIKDKGLKAGQNPSGYHIFIGLPHGTFTVAVDSDLYFPIETTVDTSILPQKDPVVKITLKPRPSYPFPGSATLVRGLVSNAGPVVNAGIAVTGKTIKTETDERGEFVLYFKGIKSELITIEIIKGANTKSVTTTIMEGKTVSIGTIHFP